VLDETLGSELGISREAECAEVVGLLAVEVCAVSYGAVGKVVDVVGSVGFEVIASFVLCQHVMRLTETRQQ